MEKDQTAHEGTHENPMQPILELLQGGDPEAICANHGISREELDQRFRDYQKTISQAALVDNLRFQKVGRNDPCLCGSGKKYKKCCLSAHEEARKSLPPDRLRAMEEQAKLRESLQKDVDKGFDLLFSQEFEKAQRLALRLLEMHPEDDRLHDIVVSTALVSGDYERAFHASRRRWQVAQEEKAYFQEHGAHMRESEDGKLAYFYSPSTWLERFWIAERARTYTERFPTKGDSRLAKLVEELHAANDIRRFPAKHEEGYEARKAALAPVLVRLESEGTSAVPYLLPLTYWFSWASLFVPDLLHTYGTDESIGLLAELSMFRFPYFSQKCLVNLETFGERAVPQIEGVITKNPVFDELKVGLIMVLGEIPGRRSFEILARLTDHGNTYVVNWVAEALGRRGDPEALPYLEKVEKRVGESSKIEGAIKDLMLQSQR